jgi:hypothetical protein
VFFPIRRFTNLHLTMSPVCAQVKAETRQKRKKHVEPIFFSPYFDGPNWFDHPNWLTKNPVAHLLFLRFADT